MKYKLNKIITEYTEKNTDNLYQPVAVGKYGIRQRSDIYKKELAKDYSKNKVIKQDTMIIGMGSTQIDFGVLSDNKVYSVSPAYHTFKINTSIVKSDFFELLLKAKNEILTRKYMIESARQGKSVNLKEMVLEEVIIPDFDIQQQIIERISSINNLISIEKNRIALFDELVKSRFIEMFGNPINNSFNLPLKRFDEISENLDYRRRPITSSDRVKGVYPYYGASGIVDYVEDYIFDEDILLISEDGANLLMRSSPIAFSVSGKVWVNNHAHVVRFKEIATQKYIENYFSQINISDYVTGSAQPKFNQSKLNGMMIPMPELSKQKEFSNFVKQIDKSKFIIQNRIKLLEELLNTKMYDYFVE